ncbi:MAG: replication initiator protein [Microviridae sp.]|nr:MAG: replication initiator protein [Microviridae sp.]
MCIYPTVVKNPKYKPNKKNGGNVPDLQDKRIGYVPVACGMCMQCMEQKAREWRVRLLEEVKHQKLKGNFVTFTFSDEGYKELVERAKKEIPGIKGYDLDNQVATIAVHKWRERWRKHNKKSPRHWFITELGHGETEHLHLHGIVWTDMPEEIDKRWRYEQVDKNKWKYGWCTLGDGKGRNYVNEETISYITKYITKADFEHKYYKPKILTSPGIGKQFAETFNAQRCKYKGEDTKTTYTTPQGYEINLNVYWRNKIYTEEEREKLWIAKLDKGEQWIYGEKIKADDSENRAKLLKYYQKVSERLGYGSPGNWEAKKYEEERRGLYQNKRIIEKREEEEKEEKTPSVVKIGKIETGFQEPGLEDW